MIFPRHVIDALIVDAREQAPFEACGIIGARDGQAVKLYPARNVAANPTIAYELDGADQYGISLELEHTGLELGAIYHSHPRAPAFPSRSDVELARYPDALYVIVGLADFVAPVIRAYRIVEGVVAEEEIVAE